MLFGGSRWRLICKLGIIFLAFWCCAYAEGTDLGLPVPYGVGLVPTMRDLSITAESNNYHSSKAQILLSPYVLCARDGSEVAKFIRANSSIQIYVQNLNKFNYSCILSRPGSQVLKFNMDNGKDVDLNLKLYRKPINLNPSIMDLIYTQNLVFSNPMGESEVPLLSTTSWSLSSIPRSNLICQDQQQKLENYVLDLYQPIHLHSQITTINKIQYAVSTRQLASEMKTAYQPLPSKLTQGLQPLLATISINGNQSADQSPELVYVASQVACLNNAQLLKYKIGDNHSLFYEYFQPDTDPLVDSSLKCVIDGKNQAKFVADQQAGTINFILPTDSTEAQNINLGTNNEPVYPSGEIYANSTSYQLGTGQTVATGTATTNLLGTFTNTSATPYGSLINGLTGGSSTQFTRNYTYWQSDFPLSMTSLIVGDATPMLGSWGGATPYAGLQYGSNEALRPGYFFTATPIISGSVNTPTTAELLLNGAQTNQLELPGGKFNLYNLPVINGDGSMTINLKNPNGDGFQSYTLPYYTSPLVLTNTTYLYQYNLGMPQGQIGSGWNLNNYQSSVPVAATQHYIGITSDYTLELRGEGQAGNFANFGISHNNIWFNKFSTGLTTAVSQSESGTGTLLGFNLSRQTSLSNSIGFGYNVNLYSANFMQLGATNGQSYQMQQTVFTNYVASNGFSIALGFSNNSAMTTTNEMQLYNMSLNWQIIPKLMLTSSTSLTNQAGIQTLGSNLGVTLTLDGASALSGGYAYQNTQGSASNSYNVNYQNASADNLSGYNIGGQYNDIDTTTPTEISGGGYYLFKNFNANAQASYADTSNYNAGASITGNAVVGAHGVSFGQFSSLSYIVVQVGKLPNIGIKQNGTVIGSTDRNGVFVIPNISPYLPQDIQVNAVDLPFNVELDSYEKRVVAPLNGGSRVVFTPVSYTPASAFVTYNNGKLPPVGYSASLYNAEDDKLIETVYIIDNGAVQLSKFSDKLKYRLEFTVKEGTYSCPISKDDINKTDSNQYITVLGTLQCSKKP